MATAATLFATFHGTSQSAFAVPWKHARIAHEASWTISSDASPAELKISWAPVSKPLSTASLGCFAAGKPVAAVAAVVAVGEAVGAAVGDPLPMPPVAMIVVCFENIGSDERREKLTAQELNSLWRCIAGGGVRGFCLDIKRRRV